MDTGTIRQDTDNELVVCTGRVCHRTVITLNDDGEPQGAICECGARWAELTDPPATEWFHVHTSPKIIRAEVVR